MERWESEMISHLLGQMLISHQHYTDCWWLDPFGCEWPVCRPSIPYHPAWVSVVDMVENNSNARKRDFGRLSCGVEAEWTGEGAFGGGVDLLFGTTARP